MEPQLQLFILQACKKEGQTLKGYIASVGQKGHTPTCVDRGKLHKHWLKHVPSSISLMKMLVCAYLAKLNEKAIGMPLADTHERSTNGNAARGARRAGRTARGEGRF